MDNHSLERLARLHPNLIKTLPLVISDLNLQVSTLGHLWWEISQGYRTFEEQNKLYYQRPRVTKAPGGLSDHNYGLAADLVLMNNGKPDWSKENDHLYNLIGPVARKYGLRWGGNWETFVDRPHVYVTGSPAVRACLELWRRGGLKAVWAAVPII